MERQRGAEVFGLVEQEEGVQVHLRHGEGGPVEQLQARWVLGCDGGRSTLRRLLGIRLEGTTASQPWLVVDARPQAPLSPRAFRFLCDPARPAVSTPLPEGLHRFEFMLLPGEQPEALLAPHRLQALLAPWGGLSRLSLVRAACYTFHARVAERFRQGRVLLLGDAAHLAPPFAGQGLCAGLRDAMNVAWKVARVARGLALPSLLDSYEAERKPHVVAMTRLARGLGAFIQTTSRPLAAVRDTLLRGLGPWLSEDALKVKPAPRLASGLFLEDGGGLGGSLLAQPWVPGAEGRVRLDEVLGPGWALVGVGVEPRQALSAEGLATLEWLGARCLALHGPAAQALAPQGTVLLVRPDRFLFSASGPVDVPRALRALLQQMHAPKRVSKKVSEDSDRGPHGG